MYEIIKFEHLLDITEQNVTLEICIDMHGSRRGVALVGQIEILNPAGPAGCEQNTLFFSNAFSV